MITRMVTTGAIRKSWIVYNDDKIDLLLDLEVGCMRNRGMKGNSKGGLSS